MALRLERLGLYVGACFTELVSSSMSFLIHAHRAYTALVFDSFFPNSTAYGIIRNFGVPIGKLHHLSGADKLAGA